MSFFKAGLEGKLAQVFAEKPSDLAAFHSLIRRLHDSGVLQIDTTQTDAYISKSMQMLVQAPHVIFQTYDSWAGETDGNDDGPTLYQLVNGTFVEKLGLGSNGVPHIDTLLKYLAKNDIKSLVTTSLGDTEVAGLMRVSRDNQDIIERKPVCRDTDLWHALLDAKVSLNYIPIELLVPK